MAEIGREELRVGFRLILWSFTPRTLRRSLTGAAFLRLFAPILGQFAANLSPNTPPGGGQGMGRGVESP